MTIAYSFDCTVGYFGQELGTVSDEASAKIVGDKLIERGAPVSIATQRMGVIKAEAEAQAARVDEFGNETLKQAWLEFARRIELLKQYLEREIKNHAY